MSVVGYSTLEVIPTVKGLASQLEKQTNGQFAAAGKRAGQQFGDSASREAGGRLRSGLKAAFAPAAGILAGLGGAKIFGDMISEAEEAAKVGRITETLIKSTGGAANLSASQVGNLANSMSKYAAIDDELIQSGENVLLTFKNIRNEAGKGNDVFARATKASLDLSTVLGGDMKTSALQLGKALNDPVKGMTLLGRAGVQFTADQKAQVKALVASNDLLGAQKVILKEVEGQVGGAAGANATAIDRLQVSFKNLEEAAGTAAAPALNKFATIAANDLIPAIEGVGGFVGDAAQKFAALPGPVKVATGAFIALRVAALAGVGTSLASGVTAASSALVGLRIRAMLAADAFRAASGSGLGAALAGIRVGAAGAATALRAVGTAFLPVAVITAAVTVWSKFRQAQADAKQRVQELTDTLDAQTGALTDNTKATVRKALLDSGALASAQRLGLSLEQVTNAALGQGAAYEAVSAQMRARGQLDTQAASDAIKVKGAIDGQSGVVKKAVDDWHLLASAQGQSTATSGAVSAATAVYTDKIKAARDAVQKLLDVENKRRNANLGAFQDRTRIAGALADAQKEAADGKRTLDENTEAGRKNRDSLSALADAWNSSAKSVQNSKGAYAGMRENFIGIAEKMGATKAEAEKLARRLLDLPSRRAIDVTTPGMKQALADLREAHRLIKFGTVRISIQSQAAKNRAALADLPGHAGGGMIGGRGSGTSDSNLIWASRGEFMQRKAAVDYYGPDFMRRLNALQVPKYASGGLIGPAPTPAPVPLGQEIQGALRIVDGVAYIEGVARAVGASDRRAARLSGLDAVRR